VFWKGHSTGPLLNQLVLRLCTLEMGGRVKIHIVHVAGTRMITQGTNGLSQGELTEGVMSGKSTLSFIPLGISVISRQPSIVGWLTSWVPAGKLTLLGMSDWTTTGQGSGPGSTDIFGFRQPTEASNNWLVWHTPPAIADTAGEQLERSRRKRSHINHIYMGTRLMTYAWWKRLTKVCNLVFKIPPGACLF